MGEVKYVKKKVHYFLMISCPGDVVRERELLKKVVDEVNSERTEDWVELKYWMTDTFSDAGMQAQDSINKQIVNESDGLVAIFNARLGTPTKKYRCGTEEEIELMLAAGKHVSLLFNTKPSIDLEHPGSIEQIQKLQNFRNEQSNKAYYRVFQDENSFLTLARREILMWLRSINKNSDEKSTDDITLNENEQKESSKASSEETPPLITNEEVEVIDHDAGTIDCVVYIDEAAQTMTKDINTFMEYSGELASYTEVFVNNLNLIKGQPNSNKNARVMLQKLSTEINKNRDKSDTVLSAIENKWKELTHYTMIFDKNQLNAEDRIILKDSINSLKKVFENIEPQIDEVIDTILAIPNYQKDLKVALVNYSNLYKKFKRFVMKAMDDCDEIVVSLIV